MKTFKRWKKLSKLSKKLFGLYNLCLASSNESEKNLKFLGASKVKFIGNLKADQTIVDTDGVFEGELKTEELIISGFVNGKVDSDNIIIMENGKISGDITYNQLAVFEGGIIDVAGMKRREKQKDDKIIDIANSNEK